MTAFTNLFGTKIENKPFYQSSLKVWRIARFENGSLEKVFENKSFNSFEECLKEC